MAKQLISSDRKWICSSSDPLETEQVADGSEMYISDTGENYVFFDGAWFPDLRMNNAIESVQTLLAPSVGKGRTPKKGTEPKSIYAFTVQTTAPNETFALPLEATGTYNFNVNWGDGNSNRITAWDHADVTHTYAVTGTYTISITDTIIGWRFDNAGDCAKYYETKSWGPLRLGNSSDYFYGCANHTCTATDVLDLAGTTLFWNAFRGNTSLTTIPSINSWNWSNITDSRLMFYGCTSYNQLLTGDFSNIATMYYLLSGAISYDQDMSGWNISSLITADNLLENVTLSVANYDALILSWGPQAQTVVANFHGGNSKYTGGGAVEAARDAWIAKGWTITDGGIAP